MKQKTYFIVLSVLAFVLNWVGFLTLNIASWADNIYIGLLFSMVTITIMFGLSMYFFIFRKNIIVLHCNMALNVFVSILFPSIFISTEELNSFSLMIQMICSIIIGIFYLIGYLCFRKNTVNQIKNLMYIAGVSIFSALLAFTNFIYVQCFDNGNTETYRSFLIFNLDWFTLGALIIGLGFYLLYCMGKATKPFAVGAVGLNGILTVTVIVLNFLAADLFSSEWTIMFVGMVLSYLIFFAFALVLFAKDGFVNRQNNKSNRSGTKKEAGDYIKDLENLYSLFKSGAITEDEFQTEKNKILGGK